MSQTLSEGKTRTCGFPGCDRPRCRREGRRSAPPAYCDNPAHNKDTAYRARRSATIAAHIAAQESELQRLRDLIKSAGLAPEAADGVEQVA